MQASYCVKIKKMPSRKRLAAKARKARARSSTTQCRHGCEQVSTESTQHQFVREFERTSAGKIDSNNFQEIFDDKDKQLQLFPLFLNLGTNFRIPLENMILTRKMYLNQIPARRSFGTYVSIAL